LLMA